MEAYITLPKTQAGRIILHYGKPVFATELFHRGLRQTHHGHTTVGIHSIGVAVNAVNMGLYLCKLGIPIDFEALAIGALCHDLGIIGRHDKFKNNLHCCFKHPMDSVTETAKIYPGLSKKTKRIIAAHMWPQGILIPTSLEGILVILADKSVSTKVAAAHRKIHKQFDHALKRT